MADHAPDSDAGVKRDQRKLRRLSATRFAADNDDLMVQDGFGDLFGSSRNGQRFIQLRFRERSLTFRKPRLGLLESLQEVL